MIPNNKLLLVAVQPETEYRKEERRYKHIMSNARQSVMKEEMVVLGQPKKLSNRYDTVYNLLNSSNEKVKIPYLKKTRNETKTSKNTSSRLCHLTKKTDNSHWNKIKQKEHNMKATKKATPTNSNKQDKATQSKKEDTAQLVGRHRSSFDNSFESEETTCINDLTYNIDDNNNQTFYQHLFSSQYKFSYFSPVGKN